MPRSLPFRKARLTLGLACLGASAALAQLTPDINTHAGLTAGTLGPPAVTLGPDGAMWFADAVGGRIVRYEPGGTITDIPITSSSQPAPEGITVGPDGAIWFTEYNAAKVGRIDPVSASITAEYSVGANPWGITTGPDGALWFAEVGAQRIGRLDLTTNPQTFTQSGLIPNYGQPYGITLGPDGNLWFADFMGKIGKITPVGMTITEYGGLATNATPIAITPGPDGNIWFTEFNGQNIGSIATDGSGLVEYPIPSGFFPLGITTGPDGNLWFTVQSGGYVGTITTSGVMQEYQIPGVSEPAGIAVGPEGALYIADQAGTIDQVSLPSAAPVMTLYPNLFGPYGYFPYLTTLGRDNAIWFTDVNDYIGRATTQGSVTEYQIPTSGVVPEGIALGLDGNLWFTEFTGGNKIGRITPAGVFAEFSLPNPNSEPVAIISGPDGALWFTEAAGRIGRIDLMGNLTEYAIPTSDGGPQGITVGPDGALWFTEQAVGQIGRITTSGAVTEFPLTMSAAPLMIAAGPDLGLWFTDPGNNAIGRITTAGVVNEYPVPTMNSFPFGIDLGPDGAMWFAEQQANNVGRVDPNSHTITEYPVQALGQSQPWGGIVSGPDGALWFTDGSSVGGIARLAATVASDTSVVKIITSNPPGIPITVGVTSYSTPVAFVWPNGSLHTLNAAPPQGASYSFSSWSDGQPQSHTISAGPAPTVYVANFNAYQLTANVTPLGAGSVTPASGTSYGPGTNLQVTAQANQGYYFNSWSGALTGSMNPQSLLMNGPEAVTANFTACPVITVASNPATLPNGTVGQMYSIAFGATGGAGSYSFSATGVPSWATFTPAGAFSGTPTAGAQVSFTVTATDSNGCTGILIVSFTVAGSGSLPPVQVTDNETITVTDTPSFPHLESITVTDTPFVTALTSIGAPVAFFSAGSLGFGGQSGTQSVTGSNIGQLPMTLSSAVITGAAFGLMQMTCSTAASSLPTTLPAGGACIFVVSSQAPASGTALNGTLTFTDNASVSNLTSTSAGSNYTQTLALNVAGFSTGPPPPPLIVAVSVTETITMTDSVTVLALTPVPNVVSSTQASAMATIAEAGLTLAPVIMQASNSVPSGYVISENPTAGALVAANSAVILVVSSGAPQVTVPNVVGLTQATATAAIQAAGLVVGTITQSANTTVLYGEVISQGLAAGHSANPGSAVSLVVSSSIAEVLPPQLSAAFQLSSIPLNGITLLTLTFSNPNPGFRLSGVAFTDALPSALAIAYPTGLVNTCGGSLVAGAGLGIFTLSGGSVAAGGTCEISLNVTGTATGAFQNSITVASVAGTSSTTTGTLTVQSGFFSPTSGVIGQTLDIAITGSGFVNGQTFVTFGGEGSGITVNSVTVTDPGHATANVTITNSANAGPIQASVTTGGNSAVLGTFTVNRGGTLSPNTGILDQTLNITLTGIPFASGATLTFAPSGIIVNSFTVLSSTEAIASITLTKLGTFNATVNNGAGIFTLNGAFEVQLPLLVLSSKTASEDENLNLTLTGMLFQNGATTLKFSDSAIVVNSITIVNQTEAIANITIDAAPGVYSVTARSGSISSTLVDEFRVLNAALVVSPNTATKYESLNVTLTGFQFVNGSTTVAIGSSDIVVNSATVVNNTEAIANITVNAPQGRYSVTVNNGQRSFKDSGAFTVQGEALLVVSPNIGIRGENARVTLTGLTFSPSSTVQFGDASSGITVNSVEVPDNTQAIANVSIASNAPIRSVNVTVDTGQLTFAFHDLFSVEDESLTLIPNSGEPGQTINVALVGLPIETGTTLRFEPAGITVNSVTLPVDGEPLANITISPNALPGTTYKAVVTTGKQTFSFGPVFTVVAP
jgi:streptogramin lyase